MDRDKAAECEAFDKMLNEYKISYKRCSEYHFQVQRVYNFYPTTGIFYNSDTGKKFEYPEFKDGNDFLKFLGENSLPGPSRELYNVDYILKVLQGCTEIRSAVTHFKRLKHAE